MKMKTLNSLFAGLLIAGSVISCTNTASEQEETEKSFPVKVTTVAVDTIPLSIEYTANLKAYEEVHYAPAQPGRIESIQVEVGNRVSEGQILVEMDKTSLQQALIQYQTVKNEFLRADTLYKLGSFTEQQFQQIKAQYEAAETSLEFSRSNTTLTSPLNGIVTGKYYEAGELYSGAPNTSAGKAAIVSLMQINPLKAVVNVSEAYFPQLKTGMKAVITTDIFPDQSFSGTVNLVYPTIDPGSRTFQVEIRVDNPRETLRPGMFARVVLNLGQATAIVAPANAVIQQEGTNNRYVFVHENGVARKIDVTVGNRYEDKLQIVSGELQEGMQLITAGQDNLLDGASISVN